MDPRTAFQSFPLRAAAPPRLRAFTLLELLVVIAILAVMLAIAIPALGYVRGQGRRAVCQSNLRQIAMATTTYHVDNQRRFWRYYHQAPEGRYWWFGFEPDGPGSGTDRPLDKTRGVLAPYLDGVNEQLQCPDFPYHDPLYSQKFTQRAASYGYNIQLGPAPRNMPVARVDRIGGHAGRVVVFADAVHFDFGQTFNEGHYLYPIPNARQPSGYAHFRHFGEAQMAMADASVTSQQLNGPAFRNVNHAPTGNLTGPDGSLDIHHPDRR